MSNSRETGLREFVIALDIKALRLALIEELKLFPGSLLFGKLEPFSVPPLQFKSADAVHDVVTVFFTFA